jgi:adenosylmethionine-8-amino-7-oxononanoate aminotransferase
MIGLQLGCSASGAERIFLDHGLVVGVSGDTVRINPPLTIEAEQLSAATTDIAAALDELLAQQERS